MTSGVSPYGNRGCGAHRAVRRTSKTRSRSRPAGRRLARSRRAGSGPCLCQAGIGSTDSTCRSMLKTPCRTATIFRAIAKKVDIAIVNQQKFKGRKRTKEQKMFRTFVRLFSDGIFGKINFRLINSCVNRDFTTTLVQVNSHLNLSTLNLHSFVNAEGSLTYLIHGK